MNGRLTLAKKYATAYLNLFDEQFDLNSIGRVHEAISFFDHPEVQSALKLPTIASDCERDNLQRVLERFQLPVSLMRLVDLLLVHKRIVLFPDILVELSKLYKERHGIATYQIISSQKLDEKDLASINAFLSKLSGKHIISTEKIHESLIAGIRLQSETTLWEYSIRKQLNELKHHVTM